MGRWTQYDEDEYRLPEGMRRAGYDADSGKYYYKDRGGSFWEGSEGARYGEMKQVKNAPISLDDMQEEDADLEAASSRADGYQALAQDAGSFPRVPRLSNNSAYRTLFPFFMIVIVFLLLAWRLVFQPSHSGEPSAVFCSGSTDPYRIQTGDTCWDLAQSHGFSVDELQAANRELVCEKLVPGEVICIPSGTRKSRGSRR